MSGKGQAGGTKPQGQRGGFVLGLIVGLLLGLTVALGVALYITKVPIPFINKVPQRTAEHDAEEAARNKNWDPNAPLAGKAGDPWFLSDVDEHSRLDRMEQALRSCTLWLWLDLRFPGIYGHVAEVADLRGRLNDGIERHLKGKKPLWRSNARGPRR